MSTRRETGPTGFKKHLVEILKQRFIGVVILPGPSDIYQGFPDLLCLHGNKWFALEVKASQKSRKQPNQDWYIDYLNGLSYAAVVYPENLEEVLDEIQSLLTS